MVLAISHKIKTLRKENSMTLEQLAELTDSNKSYLWELENPKSGKKPINPSIQKIKLIADAFAVSIGFLIDNEENEIALEKETLFSRYKKLSPEDQKRIDDMIVAWSQ